MDAAHTPRDQWFKRYAQLLPSEAALHTVSLAACGLHSHGQRLMHAQGQPYGHLSVAPGVPIDVRELAKRLSKPKKTIQNALNELLSHHVWLKNDETGVIFDPCLVAQYQVARKSQEDGAKGGNPQLRRNNGPQVNPPVNPQVNPQVNPPVNPPVNPDRQTDRQTERETDARALEEGVGEGSGAVIPTVAEVIDFGQGPAGIPEDFCRHYHATCEEKKRWLVRNGQALIAWRKELPRWWANDRAKWETRQRDKPVTSNANALRQQIETETDPIKKAALRRRLSELND